MMNGLMDWAMSSPLRALRVLIWTLFAAWFFLGFGAASWFL